MTPLVLGVLAGSLLGSLHCAGMCGPLVFVWAGAGGNARSAWWGHVAYNAGRLAAYAALGAAAGALGAAIDLGGRMAGIQRAAAIVSGLLIAAWGAAALAQARGSRGIRLEAPRALRALPAKVLAAVGARSIPARAATLGLLSALLPCGWLWAFVATAAGTGSPARAAGIMAVFWVGTLPALVAVGAAARALAGPFRRHLPVACATLVVVLGLLVVADRAWHATRPAPGASQTVPAEPPCHAGH